MLSHCVLATGIAIIATLTSANASAQTCDGPFPWLCRRAPESVQRDQTKQKLRATTAVKQAKRDMQRKQRNAVRPAMTPEEKEVLFRDFLEWQKQQSAGNPEEK